MAEIGMPRVLTGISDASIGAKLLLYALPKSMQKRSVVPISGSDRRLWQGNEGR